MIRVIRAAKPSILTKKAGLWLLALNAAATAPAREKAVKKYRQPQIKNALKTMFHGKCAYCESYILHVSYPHIEHFCPRSVDADKTFEWTNLLLACGVCNGPEYKGVNFPDASQGGPLINPCDVNDDPSVHFQFDFDASTKLATVSGITQRGNATERILGLNRKELREYRSRQVKKLVALAEFAATDATARQLIVEAAQSEAEYSAFARVILANAQIP